MLMWSGALQSNFLERCARTFLCRSHRWCDGTRLKASILSEYGKFFNQCDSKGPLTPGKFFVQVACSSWNFLEQVGNLIKLLEQVTWASRLPSCQFTCSNYLYRSASVFQRCEKTWQVTWWRFRFKKQWQKIFVIIK